MRAESLSTAARLANLPPDELNDVIKSMSDEEAQGLLHNWREFHARPEQIAPEGDWEIWLILSGRGWGKTRTGAEWVKENIENNDMRRVALVAETAWDARNVMVEGDSGILSLYPAGKRPIFEPSNRVVRWPSLGAEAFLYNATEPDSLRGPQHDGAWSDELAKWKYARSTWDQLQYGVRVGDDPRQLVTTTPRPIEVVKAIFAGEEGKVSITRGDTRDNYGNLSPKFIKKIYKKYEGTRLGRQELAGEILGDFPNSLWTQAGIDLSRVNTLPRNLGRVVVAVDPAASDSEEREDVNENGIMVCAASSTGEQGYLLEDATLIGSPNKWARRAIAMFDHHQADAIVVEVNNGGAMVANTVRAVRNNIPIIEVRATRGKHVRAEPISALYEQGRISHVGAHPVLEDQMTMMTTDGFQGEGSPDRVDALVWGFTELFKEIVYIDDRHSSTKKAWRPRKGIV